MTTATAGDVLRKIELCNELIDDANDEMKYDEARRANFATQALAQAQLATAYATLMVAENQPLGVLTDIAREVSALASIAEDRMRS